MGNAKSTETKAMENKELQDVLDKLAKMQRLLEERDELIVALENKGKKKRTTNDYAVVALLEQYHDTVGQDKNGDGLPTRSFKQVYKFLAECHHNGVLKYKHHSPIPQTEVINAFVQDMGTFAGWEIVATIPPDTTVADDDM